MATRLSASGPKVAGMVVDGLVETELGRRAKLVHAALAKVDELSAKRAKLEQPDGSYFDTEGNEVKTFTSGRMGERRKLEGDIAKLNAAVDAAIGETDAAKQKAAYESIEKLTKGGNEGGNGGGDKA